MAGTAGRHRRIYRMRNDPLAACARTLLQRKQIRIYDPRNLQRQIAREYVQKANDA